MKLLWYLLLFPIIFCHKRPPAYTRNRAFGRRLQAQNHKTPLALTFKAGIARSLDYFDKSWEKESSQSKYCEDLKVLKRFPSRSITVGKLKIGSQHPIACQTMVNTQTRDVLATLDQILKCTEAGADLVRITVQGTKEVECSHKIKDLMIKYNCDTPIVADVHFNPKIASLAVEVFDKIRINPGNYVDGRKSFVTKEYSNPNEFLEGRKRIEHHFVPLIEKCKLFNRALRIGTNHGSLSSRIMSYYGDSPLGMVESAFEFATICRNQDFHNFCFSMKSSNPFVMINAYRLLTSEMYKRNYNYPIHLGVTEAGEGEDGRIKSAIGIGSLLQDGIGDTIRVSLTEDPWKELQTCHKLASSQFSLIKDENEQIKMKRVPDYIETTRDFRNLSKRNIKIPMHPITRDFIHKDGSIFLKLDLKDLENPDVLSSALGIINKEGQATKGINTPDSIFLTSIDSPIDEKVVLSIKTLEQARIGIIANYRLLINSPIPRSIATFDIQDFGDLLSHKSLPTYHGKLSPPEGSLELIPSLTGGESEGEILSTLRTLEVPPSFLLLRISPQFNHLRASRRIFDILKRNNIYLPVIHHFVYNKSQNFEDLTLSCAHEVGSLLIDKLGDGLLLETKFPYQQIKEFSFNLLQGTRMRNIKTEFISCPSCGRTLFDLQEVTKDIKNKTGHLPGISIAIMGCIVNGVGEMADADFGYVGGSPGKVDLYVGKQVIERGIPNEEACDRLIALIKSYGRWKDP